MNIFNTNYIGATGIYPIYEYIDNTSNVLTIYIQNTSNNLIIYSSNVGIVASNFTKDRTTLKEHQSLYPENFGITTLFLLTPPFFLPLPTVLIPIIPEGHIIPTQATATNQFLSTAIVSKVENMKNTFDVVGFDLYANNTMIEKKLQEHDVSFVNHEISAQWFQSYNSAKTTANTTAISVVQTEIIAIQKVLAITASATAFNTLYNIEDFIGNSVTFFFYE